MTAWSSSSCFVPSLGVSGTAQQAFTHIAADVLKQHFKNIRHIQIYMIDSHDTQKHMHQLFHIELCPYNMEMNTRKALHNSQMIKSMHGTPRDCEVLMCTHNKCYVEGCLDVPSCLLKVTPVVSQRPFSCNTGCSWCNRLRALLPMSGSRLKGLHARANWRSSASTLTTCSCSVASADASSSLSSHSSKCFCTPAATPSRWCLRKDG